MADNDGKRRFGGRHADKIPEGVHKIMEDMAKTERARKELEWVKAVNKALLESSERALTRLRTIHEMAKSADETDSVALIETLADIADLAVAELLPRRVCPECNGEGEFWDDSGFECFGVCGECEGTGYLDGEGNSV